MYAGSYISCIYTNVCVYILNNTCMCICKPYRLSSAHQFSSLHSVCIYVYIYNIIISLHIITLKVSNVYGTFQNCKEELAQHALALKTTIAVAWN